MALVCNMQNSWRQSSSQLESQNNQSTEGMDSQVDRNRRSSGSPENQASGATLFWCHKCKIAFHASIDSQFSRQCACGSAFIETINPANDPRELYHGMNNETQSQSHLQGTPSFGPIAARSERPPARTLVVTLSFDMGNGSLQGLERLGLGAPRTSPFSSNDPLTGLGAVGPRVPIQSDQTVPGQSPGAGERGLELSQEREPATFSSIFGPFTSDRARTQDDLEFPAGSPSELARLQSGFNLLMDLGRRLAMEEPGL